MSAPNDTVQQYSRSGFVIVDPVAREAGRVLGNVCRWRVGDRRHPKDSRVPGSCYEHARLDTRFTHPDDDPAAFVSFLLDGDG